MESFDYIPYLYGLARYGNVPLIEHLEYQEVHKLEELVIAIDTSGSCRTDTVRRFMEETYGILSDRENFFRKMNVYIIQCDFCVQDVAHITCEEEWKEYLGHLTIHGRSGTDFRPVFAYVEELQQKKALQNLKGLLYFTDGDGIYPQKPVGYETAFVFYREKERHQQVPAWAVRLEQEGEDDEYQGSQDRN
jgi:predicted metal-dependent peptidase